jgi:hypothetical protein
MSFAILMPEGSVTVSEVCEELKPGKWVPILSFTHQGDLIPVIPIFTDEKTAKTFIRRNLPQETLRGAVALSEETLEKLRSKGLVVRSMSYPNQLTNQPDIKFESQILELEEEPDVLGIRGSRRFQLA